MDFGACVANQRYLKIYFLARNTPPFPKKKREKQIKQKSPQKKKIQ
jgi:hypothetical protein